uniref:Uncharacterized protein n=1 Tax=Picea glauca TaxID=3330 RepID=A0A124GMV3_PICGL|nr:hypothetical protein ABT39_MTgene6308 [Picea glauca]QHR88012.1 hypothetical protein Q903MT_gene2024 [Picea sitchensis]
MYLCPFFILRIYQSPPDLLLNMPDRPVLFLFSLSNIYIFFFPYPLMALGRSTPPVLVYGYHRLQVFLVGILMEWNVLVGRRCGYGSISVLLFISSSIA